jgi:hypothetical protein
MLGYLMITKLVVVLLVAVIAILVLSLVLLLQSWGHALPSSTLLVVANIGLTVLLVLVGALALTTWKREKDFTIARNLYLALFELDREAVGVRDSLDLAILVNVERFGKAEPLRTIDYSSKLDQVLQACSKFQSALVEAAARWNTNFGLDSIGGISTHSIEYAIVRLIEFGAALDKRDPNVLGAKEREQATAELRQNFLQLGKDTRDTLEKERETFYEAFRPMIEKHFISGKLLD